MRRSSAHNRPATTTAAGKLIEQLSRQRFRSEKNSSDVL
jgi:hypothetical protein